MSPAISFVLRFAAPAAALHFLASCGSAGADGNAVPDSGTPPGKADRIGRDGQIEPKNLAAGDMVVYEVQARSANACSPATGGEACAARIAPHFDYFGPGCDALDELAAIRKGTLDDLLADAGEPHRTGGITLRYVDEVVGANTVWLMPTFPHNFRYDLPDACDDLGSPYAVRDYLHVRGSLSDRCVVAGRDEWSDEPCWGDDALDRLIAAAHARGMKVMLDLAFNHFGHEYLFYDLAGVVPVRDRLAEGPADDMWDFDATFEEALVRPEVLDDPAELPPEAPRTLEAICGAPVKKGPDAVRRWLMWREAFDHERAAMDCGRPATLEQQVPGFYLARDAWSPSRQVGDNYTNDWRDVKFLFHNARDSAHAWEFARTREYVFRVVDWWLSRGVDAFRMDHANGLTENEWRYVIRKARYYQQKRGMPPPVFLSESFHDIEQLNRVFDALTEGYHHDICNGRRNARDLESKLFEGRTAYLHDLSFVLLNLETHDEGRLLKPYTGFDIWRGATFYSIAAASRGMLMLQVGQEWGEPWDLGFRRSDYLRGRFPAEPNWDGRGDKLTDLYRAIHRARLAPENAALRWGKYYFPRTDKGEVKEQLFAMVKHMEDCSNTVFAFARLWTDDVEATYAVGPDLAGRICLSDGARYRLVDVLTGRDVWAAAHPDGRTGAHLREFGIYVRLDLGTPFQWLRLERI
ncbi:MAG: hypothetical protein FJ087_17765 [Deltaproteobacteria bacterium]|nr:hypothetical protein [Deltaproteobacteria bacterium]